MLRFYWTPVIASKAFLFLPPDDSRSTMKPDRFSLCLKNCLLTRTQLSITDSMDTHLRSHRGLLVPTNKANDISRAMHLAWCTICLHPPPLSPEFSKVSRLLVLYPWDEASIWKVREYRDFHQYRLLLSFASLVTKARLGQRPTLYIII